MINHLWQRCWSRVDICAWWGSGVCHATLKYHDITAEGRQCSHGGCDYWHGGWCAVCCFAPSGCRICHTHWHSLHQLVQWSCSAVGACAWWVWRTGHTALEHCDVSVESWNSGNYPWHWWWPTVSPSASRGCGVIEASLHCDHVRGQRAKLNRNRGSCTEIGGLNRAFNHFA